MQSLSIAQQRIALVIFAVLIGAAVWWQHAVGRADHVVGKFSPKDFTELDFTNAEAAWRDLQIDADGHLQIDALTESALLDAITLLNEHRGEMPMARMSLLLEKQFGVTASRQIMELLPRLRRYKEAEQRWWTENGSRNPPPHAELFRLQDELLGETLAKELFSEQRRLVNLMLASQQIRSDVSLTPAQRDRALMELQEGSRDGAASSE